MSSALRNALVQAAHLIADAMEAERTEPARGRYGAGTIEPFRGEFRLRLRYKGRRPVLGVFPSFEEAARIRQAVAEIRAATPARRAIPHLGIIYFVQAVDGGLIKIGFTSNPAKRMWQLQTGSASALRVLGRVRATRREERMMHSRFAELRERGEWFRPEPMLLHFIEETRDG